MSRSSLLDEIKSYVGFTEADAAILAQHAEAFDACATPVVDAFYEAIEREPRARAVFADAAQIERQRGLLRTWLAQLVRGPYDAHYLEARARIGLVHVRIGLAPAFMVTAMNVIRRGLHGAVADLESSTEARRALHEAIDRVCDVDLAIMLETYRDDYAVRIRASQKLAALGEIAGTLGHEIRNPLAVMETSLHLLRGRVPDDPKAAKQLDRLGAQIALCSRIVRDLMDLARAKEPRRAPCDAAATVRDALADLPRGGEVDVRFELPRPVVVDGVQLRQLVFNLAQNALAMATQPSEVRIRVDLAEGGVRITVEDDGPGVPEEIRPRLFEPLFSTREGGVGFGLALCRRIAEAHGGYVRAGDVQPRGARFEAVLREEKTP